jgi:hypothetical protein
MTAARHIWIFGATLGVVSALRFVFPARYGADLHRAANDATASRSREVEATWRAQAYSGFSAAKVARFEEYYRLKTDGFRWTFAPSARAVAFLGPLTGGQVSPKRHADAKEFVRLLWHKTQAGGEPCLPKLTAVCLWSVRGGIAHTNAPALLLVGPVKNGFTASYDAVDPGFDYSGAHRPGRPLVFEVSFLAKANGAESAGPVYVSLLWVEADQNWALGHLMTDVWLHINTIF